MKDVCGECHANQPEKTCLRTKRNIYLLRPLTSVALLLIEVPVRRALVPQPELFLPANRSGGAKRKTLLTSLALLYRPSSHLSISFFNQHTKLFYPATRKFTPAEKDGYASRFLSAKGQSIARQRASANNAHS